MKVVSADAVANKKVLLRMDIDVPIKDGKVIDPFRIDSGLPTLKLCLENASEVIILGHIGRPEGKEIKALSVEPIWDYLEINGFGSFLHLGKLKLLENLRFEVGEEQKSLDYAQNLAALGEVFINEAFASSHEAASTTILPKLLPSYFGLRFAKEVEVLTKVRSNPNPPLVVIIGGAKIEDKLGVVESLAKVADFVLLGGKLPAEIKEKGLILPSNVKVAQMKENGEDISDETLNEWINTLNAAKTIVWNGPVGKFEDLNNNQTKVLAENILKTESGTEVIIGGGDTIGALTRYELIEDFKDSRFFISTGGGAMLKFLEKGTLPTIDAINN